MKRALLFVAVVALLATGDLSAQCRECYFDPQTACVSCVSTNYNAYVLCDLVENGSMCRLAGECTGIEGECRTQNISAVRSTPQLAPTREWQLVSVEITHVQERKRRS